MCYRLRNNREIHEAPGWFSLCHRDIKPFQAHKRQHKGHQLETSDPSLPVWFKAVLEDMVSAGPGDAHPMGWRCPPDGLEMPGSSSPRLAKGFILRCLCATLSLRSLLLLIIISICSAKFPFHCPPPTPFWLHQHPPGRLSRRGLHRDHLGLKTNKSRAICALFIQLSQTLYFSVSMKKPFTTNRES